MLRVAEMSSPSTASPSPSPSPQQPGWWGWLWGSGSSALPASVPRPQPIEPAKAVVAPVAPVVPIPTMEVEQEPAPIADNGWERIKAIYSGPTMERDILERVVRMTFFGGFLVGGSHGYQLARQQYDTNNVGRKYLSPSDAVKRRIDYAIVKFAKSGFSTGLRAAIIAGSIVVSCTHAAAYRRRFSSWYFPAVSGVLAPSLHAVGGVFMFPLGVIGMAKAVGLGVTSGLTLTAVCHLYALSVDKPVNDAYWQFKRDYEEELRLSSEWDARVSQLMEEEGFRWRQSAVKELKKRDEQHQEEMDV